MIIDEEIQTAMNKLKQRKAGQPSNPSRRHQDLWRCDESKDKTFFNEMLFKAIPKRGG